MLQMRTCLAAITAAVCMTGVSHAQSAGSLEDRLAGAAPISSERFRGNDAARVSVQDNDRRQDRSDRRDDRRDNRSDRRDDRRDNRSDRREDRRDDRSERREDRRDDRADRRDDRRDNNRRYVERRDDRRYDGRYSDNRRVVVGSPRSNRIACGRGGAGRSYCALPRGAQRVVVSRVHGNSRCRDGIDFGISTRGLWVTNGCRADFTIVYASGYGYDRYGYSDRGYGIERYSCSSNSHRYTTCALPRGFDRVELVRRNSNASCRRGTDWGLTRAGIWVDNGCRATFEVYFDRRRYSSRY